MMVCDGVLSRSCFDVICCRSQVVPNGFIGAALRDGDPELYSPNRHTLMNPLIRDFEQFDLRNERTFG